MAADIILSASTWTWLLDWCRKVFPKYVLHWLQNELKPLTKLSSEIFNILKSLQTIKCYHIIFIVSESVWKCRCLCLRYTADFILEGVDSITKRIEQNHSQLDNKKLPSKSCAVLIHSLASLQPHTTNLVTLSTLDRKVFVPVMKVQQNKSTCSAAQSWRDLKYLPCHATSK